MVWLCLESKLLNKKYCSWVQESSKVFVTLILKISGLTRKLDKLGRIVLPSEYRKELGFKKQESLEIFLGIEGILIRKPQSICKLCGEDSDLMIFKDNLLCLNCISELKTKIL